MRDAKASLTGKRSDFCGRKNTTEDASPAPGGTGLPREGRKPVPPGAGDALGIGSDLAYGQIRPNSDSTSEPTPPEGGERLARLVRS